MIVLSVSNPWRTLIAGSSNDGRLTIEIDPALDGYKPNLPVRRYYLSVDRRRQCNVTLTRGLSLISAWDSRHKVTSIA